MTLQEIKGRVKQIEHSADDYEFAHSDEDELYYDFVRHVAETGDDALKEMAFEVLKTRDIDFARYHA